MPMLRALIEKILAHFRYAFDLPEKPSAPCDWCLVGNIVQQHAFGMKKEIREGSKHFTPGTKVYCLPSQWGDGYEKVIAVGISRGSRKWITVVMHRSLITNWRAKVVYKPQVKERLREGFNGHNLQWESREQVEKWVKSLHKWDSDKATG